MGIKDAVVKVTWRDAASPQPDGWQSAAEAGQFIGETCVDYGVLLSKDETWVVIAGGRSSSGDVHRVFAVPAGCVVNIVTCGEKK